MTTLAGRYRLEEVIGRGGMSTVYRATDGVLQRTVAVKVMSAALAEGDPTHVARFEREARAAASLVHPGIVTVYDTGVDGDHRFIAMEYIDGESLATIIAREAPLDPDRAARIAAEAADALDAAHRAGLVHRDVKPGNVMVARDGSVKVLDFGIARVADAASITRTASLIGTAAYMAPEHALGSPVDARSDVYSLGCVLYAMLTAHPPFAGEVPAAVLHQQVNVDPRPPSEANPRVSSALDALVLQMLAKAPEDRPRSAAEVRDRLRGGPVAAQGAAAAVPPTAATARLDPTAATRALREPARAGIMAPAHVQRSAPGSETWVRFGVGILAIAVVALITVLALGAGGGSHTGTQTTPPARATTSRSTPTSTTHSATTPATTPTATVTVTTPATTTPPASTTGGPPGQGGTPPGQAKKGGKGDKKKH